MIHDPFIRIMLAVFLLGYAVFVFVSLTIDKHRQRKAWKAYAELRSKTSYDRLNLSETRRGDDK